MLLIDQYKILVGAYFGIRELDEDTIKYYVMHELEEYIKNFVKQNYLDDYNLKEIADSIEDNTLLKGKLQDALIVLPKLKNIPMELILLIKAKLKGDAVGTVVYLTNKKNGIFENEKNSTVSCYVCPKCGYVELNADNAKNLI